MPLHLFLLILGSVSLNSVAQIMLRKGMLAIGGLDIHQPLNTALNVATSPFVIIGMGCYAISILSWMAVLSKAEVSVAYPFLSIGYVLAAVMGYYFLAEAITPMRMFGIALICAGMVCIAQTA